jgi:hypothetical protein
MCVCVCVRACVCVCVCVYFYVYTYMLFTSYLDHPYHILFSKILFRPHVVKAFLFYVLLKFYFMRKLPRPPCSVLKNIFFVFFWKQSLYIFASWWNFTPWKSSPMVPPCVCVYACVCVCVWMYVCMYARVCVCMYVCMYVYIYIYIHIYIYIYIYTYI